MLPPPGHTLGHRNARVVLRYPPQLFFNEIDGFETASQPYLLKYGAPCRPDVIVRRAFANMNMCEDGFFIASFLASTSHETFVKEYRRFGGGLP